MFFFESSLSNWVSYQWLHLNATYIWKHFNFPHHDPFIKHIWPNFRIWWRDFIDRFKSIIRSYFVKADAENIGLCRAFSHYFCVLKAKLLSSARLFWYYGEWWTGQIICNRTIEICVDINNSQRVVYGVYKIRTLKFQQVMWIVIHRE